MSYSLLEKAKCVSWYDSLKSHVLVRRKFSKEFGKGKPAPNKTLIKEWYTKFLATGSIHPKKRGPKAKRVLSRENMTRVQELFERAPRTSIRKASLQLNLSRSSIQRILKDAAFKPYKIQNVQALNPEDVDVRLEFAEEMIDRIETDRNLLSLIIFSDEAHFQLDGKVNKQNCRIWGKENPHEIQEVPLHSPRVTVWCGMWSQGLIGPFIFKGNVTKDSYLDLLKNFLWPHVCDLPEINKIIFQQDGAPPHFSKEVRAWLDASFPGRWIGRRGPISWPPRSPDLTPCDFALWGHLKQLVYAKPLKDLKSLQKAIKAACASLPLEFFERSMLSFRERLNLIIENGGEHIENS